jgi:predicted RecA/RadA family phage recombinase
MPTTRAILTPLSAEFPTTNYAPLVVVNTRPALAFDATTSETAYWTLVVPQGITGALSGVISYMMASATSGGVAFDVAVEAITSGDATDLDAGTSFATVNAASDATVPGTAGYMEQITVTLTNDDSLAAGDYLRVSVARDVADGADTATGDCYVLAVEIREA